MARKPAFSGRTVGQTVGSFVWNGSSWYDTSQMGGMGRMSPASLSPASYSVGGGSMANLMGGGPTSGGFGIGNNINRIMDLPAAFNSTPRPRPVATGGRPPANIYQNVVGFGGSQAVKNQFINTTPRPEPPAPAKPKASFDDEVIPTFSSLPIVSGGGASDRALIAAGQAIEPMAVLVEQYQNSANEIRNNAFANPNIVEEQIINQLGYGPQEFEDDQIINFGPGDIKIGPKPRVDVPEPRPVPPADYSTNIHFSFSPGEARGAIFTDTGEAPQYTVSHRANAKDYLSGRTLGAKEEKYGKAKEVYTIKTRVAQRGGAAVNGIQAGNLSALDLELARQGILPLLEYWVDIKLNGKVVATLKPTNGSTTINFTYEPQAPKPEPDIDNTSKVNVTHDMSMGVSGTFDFGGKVATYEGTGQITVINTATFINFTPSSSTSTHNHQYTLYEVGSGKKLAEQKNDTRASGGQNQNLFSFTGIKPQKEYNLKITISKGLVAVEPEIQPKPAPSPSYTLESYVVTENRVSGEDAPDYVKPILKVAEEIVYINIGDAADKELTIPYTTKNADWVNIKIKGSFRKNTHSNKLVLKPSDFDRPGSYQVWLQPDSNINGTGEAKQIPVIVVEKQLLPGPDITKIDYPKQIKGADFKGYNIDFAVNWESINTNYIDIFIGKVDDKNKILKKGPAMGSQEFNIGKILKQAGESLQDTADWIYFDLYFCPYNSEGDEVFKGKTESIKIAFDKGDLILSRAEVHRDISEAICHQFDASALAQDNSKFLTHLMHFGDGDNKLIATWCTDYETFGKYKDVVQDVENDEGEFVPQIVNKKIHEEQTLVLKMYEPLPRSIEPNQQIWISKIQSLPIIEQITLVNEELKECIELTPNFGKGICDPIGFQLYDDLVASGSTTSTNLMSQFVSGSGLSLKTLKIPYASSSLETSGSVLIDGESTWAWNNFVKYSSAEERVNNFLYKIKLLEFYDDKIENLKSGSFYTGSVRIKKEIEQQESSKQKVSDNFDGFEEFLYTSSSLDGLTYPGAGASAISSSDSSEATDWLNGITLSAQQYDYYNKDYLVNNLPNHVKNSTDNEEFKMFFNMIGNHFDVLWAYTKSLAQSKNLEHKYQDGIKDALLSSMLKSLGWDSKMGASAQALWEYAFGTTEDGTSVRSMTGKDRQNEVWRRLLNNLPYLLKHKGTGRAVKAALACYGVPSSMLTVLEFGGPRNADGGVSKFSFEDRTAAINISGSESILVPWKQYTQTSDHPQAVEIRINTDQKQNQTFISSSGWNLGVKYQTGNIGKVELQYVSGSNLLSSSTENIPFFNEEYNQIVVQHIGTGSFDVYVKEGFNERIRNAVSMSIHNVPTASWELDNELTIGGSTMTGSIDELRYWTTALSESRIDNHTLMPDAIDGNHHSSSTEDLLLRLDFEYPKDRNADTAIKNVSINESYVVPFVTASNFDSNSTYPYHYTTYERTVTANVPSSGFGVGNKFRFETQEGVNEDIENGLTLSYRERSTKKSFDTSPIDSNKLGLFFSPIKEINTDIMKSLGQFEIDDYIGDPSDRYKADYQQLKTLRNYYFERFTLNLYEYIQLVRYIDQSLFQTLETLVPARAIVSSGLLIEPHILERSKYQHRKPSAEDVLARIRQPKIDLKEQVKLSSQNVKRLDPRIAALQRLRFRSDFFRREGRMIGARPRFTMRTPMYNARMGGGAPNLFSSADFSDGRITDVLKVQQLLKQFETQGQQQVGVDPRNLKNGLAGIFAQNGYANITKLDGNGRMIKERKQVWVVTERFTIKEKRPIAGTGRKGYRNGKLVWVVEPDYEIVTTQEDRKIVVFNEPGDAAPSGGNIISASRANSNGGTLAGSNLGKKRGLFGRSRQTSNTTLDRRSPVETFCTNPNVLKVADTARGKGEPILEVNKK
mgnify:CR=1 FL=1